MNSTASQHPRIFVLPGAADCSNLGDLAMLQAAIQRLRRLWPDSGLYVLTRDPGALRRHCPEVLPVPWKGRNRWLKIQALPRGLFPNLPHQCARAFPLSAARVWRVGALFWPGQGQRVKAFAEAMFGADLVALAGCGLLTDAFGHNAIQMLDTLAAAQRCKIPTVLLSQGIGPITRPGLLRRAREILPRVERLFLRERRASLPWLRQLQIPDDRIAVTGDDAVAMAFHERRDAIGQLLGVSLRWANYAALTPDVVTVMRRVLTDKAHKFQARLVGLPIRCDGVDSDIQSVERLLGGAIPACDPGHGVSTPLEVIRRTSACRLVVTGSYHAGVFALAQGIPVVAIAASDYYRDKFLGLADLFGTGCRFLTAAKREFASQLGQAIEEMWQQAPALRPDLLRAAEIQTQAAQAAYRQLPVLLTSKT